jgi:hypothetical protein
MLWHRIGELANDKGFALIDMPDALWASTPAPCAAKATLIARLGRQLAGVNAACLNYTLIENFVDRPFLQCSHGLIGPPEKTAKSAAPALGSCVLDEYLERPGFMAGEVTASTKPLLPPNGSYSLVLGEWLFETTDWEKSIEVFEVTLKTVANTRLVAGSRGQTQERFGSAQDLDTFIASHPNRQNIWFIKDVKPTAVPSLFAMADIICLPSGIDRPEAPRIDMAWEAILSGKPVLIDHTSPFNMLARKSAQAQGAILKDAAQAYLEKRVDDLASLYAKAAEFFQKRGHQPAQQFSKNPESVEEFLITFETAYASSIRNRLGNVARKFWSIVAPGGGSR